jgi:AraC-like DNA-binding protein
VAEAQRLLRDDPELTILGILYQAGFNSKSAFHRAFTDVAGITPSEYRERHTRTPVE